MEGRSLSFGSIETTAIPWTRTEWVNQTCKKNSTMQSVQSPTYYFGQNCVNPAKQAPCYVLCPSKPARFPMSRLAPYPIKCGAIFPYWRNSPSSTDLSTFGATLIFCTHLPNPRKIFHGASTYVKINCLSPRDPALASWIWILGCPPKPCPVLPSTLPAVTKRSAERKITFTEDKRCKGCINPKEQSLQQ